MEKLPNEVVEIILSSPRLTCANILYFGATSKHFYNIVRQSRYIWKKKYQQCFPQFLKLFNNSCTDWYTEILNIHMLSKRTYELLSEMPPRFYKQNELSECHFADWSSLCKEVPRAYHYVVLELLNILSDCTPINSVNVVPIDTPGNKTLQYYAAKVLRFIRQLHVTQVWHEFIELPLEEQLLEKGATLIAQWCQPAVNVDWEDIADIFDSYSRQVIMEVKKEYPNHPLLNVPKETLLKWKMYNLNSNQWGVIECQQIMKCIKKVIYVHNGFTGNNHAFYMPENSYLNEVLSRRKGLPITLAIVFESIARRVGLKCEPYSFPSHFLLKFTEGTIENRGGSYYIDVFTDGNKIPVGSCPRNTSRKLLTNFDLETATPQQVVERMANNLQMSYREYAVPRTNLTILRSVLELIVTVSLQDLQAVISLSRLYMMHGIDTTSLENSLLTKSNNKDLDQVRRIVDMLHNYNLHYKHNFSEPIMQPKRKVRSKNLNYAVGMIVRHIGLNSLCIIYDWDLTCMASLEWQEQIRVQSLKYGRNQPFYQVLVADGTHCYTPQEHLTTTEPYELLALDEIGKHFSHFFVTHYVPNAEKENEYPDDAAVRHMFHQKIQFGS